MTKTIKQWLKKHEIYIERAGLVFIALSLLLFGHFVYTGKGWLVVMGKESVSDFYFNRGLYYFNGATYDIGKAEDSFQKALVHADGRHPFAHYQLSRIYFIRGYFPDALMHADMELANYPDHFRTHYVKGLTYGFRKQYAQAEEEFKLFLAQDPNPAWAGYNDLAWVYFSAGNYEGAADAASEGLKIWKDSPWLQNSYAVAKLNLGDYKTAETFFLSAQKLFAEMTPEAWGRSYPGNDPRSYEQGLQETRAAIEKNLILVHTKLGK